MSIDGLQQFKLAHGHGEVSYMTAAPDINVAAQKDGQVWVGARCGACGETGRESVPVESLLPALMRLHNNDTDVGSEELYGTLDDVRKLVHIMRKASK
jgi:hypothetical protein